MFSDNLSYSLHLYRHAGISSLARLNLTMIMAKHAFYFIFEADRKSFNSIILWLKFACIDIIRTYKTTIALSTYIK